MSFAGPIGCPKGGTGLCPGLQDSSLGCVGKLAVTSMVRMGVFVGGGGVQNLLSGQQYKHEVYDKSKL